MAKYPLISCMFTANGGRGESGSRIPLDFADRKTPAELILLMKAHGAEPGEDETVISEAKWTGMIEISAAELRADLYNRYGKGAVDQMFPAGFPVTTEYPDEREAWAERNRVAEARVADERRKTMALMQEASEQAEALATVPEPNVEPAVDPRNALRAVYEGLAGKKAFNGWTVDELTAKILEVGKSVKDDA